MGYSVFGTPLVNINVIRQLIISKVSVKKMKRQKKEKKKQNKMVMV